MWCRALLALLVLHLCKVSCLCRCIVQRLGSTDISVLALGRSPRQGLGAVAPHSAPARTPGVYAQRLYARTHISGRTKSVQNAPTKTTTIAQMHSQQSIHSLSRGKVVFGKDAEIERPKALQDAKPTKRSYRDREFALSYKNRLFLQAELLSPALQSIIIKFRKTKRQ